MAKQKHPMQPIVIKDGIARFKENKIVRFLQETSRFDLNALSAMGFDKDDWNQFAQLIGYSVGGYGDLSYADRKTVQQADEMVDQMLSKRS